MAIPIQRPGKIIAVGLNYRDHASESDTPPPESPVIFAKFPTSLIGPGDPIVLPTGAHQVDYEAELGVIIGRTARAVPRESALDHVAGYLAVNDVSDREAQFKEGQWVRGKSYDTFCPVGPVVVPARDIADPQQLRIRCWLNGELMQDANTADMIFDVAFLISHLSQRITLEPGDLIATGTPSGVGAFRSPQVFLRQGDEVTVDIENIGLLTNPVVASSGDGNDPE